jgi:hypothetical protein
MASTSRPGRCAASTTGIAPRIEPEDRHGEYSEDRPLRRAIPKRRADQALIAVTEIALHISQ